MDTYEWETRPRTWPAMASTCSTKITWASDCPRDPSSRTPLTSAPQDQRPRRMCHSHRFWNCLHCGIAFRRDFADSVIRAGPEQSYDALVQFGTAPITGMVNLQWKYEAMENHRSERSKHSAIRSSKILSEYVARRHTSSSKPWQQRHRAKGTIKWERPVCMQKKRLKSTDKNTQAKRTTTARIKSTTPLNRSNLRGLNGSY